MAIKFINDSQKNEMISAFPPLDRLYADFSLIDYPSLWSTDTYTDVISSDNRPGSKYLSGGSCIYIINMPAVFTLQIKCRPQFSYDITSNQNLVGWYEDSNTYFKVLYDKDLDKFKVMWKDGTNERYLISDQFDDGTSYININQDLTITIVSDLTTGTLYGTSLYINGELHDSEFDGNSDIKTKNLYRFEVRSIQGITGLYDITCVRLFNSILATQDDIDNNFYNIKNEEIYFKYDGIALGTTRCNITRFLNSYSYKKAKEDDVTGSQLANVMSYTLINNNGEFSDNIYEEFDPILNHFNGTINDIFLSKRTRFIHELWFNSGHFEPIFLGRINNELYKTQYELNSDYLCNITCEDKVAEIANRSLNKSIVYEDNLFCDISDESNSLIHNITRLATRYKNINYIFNSSFNNTNLTWNTFGDCAISRTSDYSFFGSYSLKAIFTSSGGFFQEVLFTGNNKLNIGDEFTLQLMILTTTDFDGILRIEERTSSALNDYVNKEISINATSGWNLIYVTKTIEDETSDRILCEISGDSGTIYVHNVILHPGLKIINNIVLNDNSETTHQVSADEYSETLYDTCGFICEQVTIEHPWYVVSNNVKIWNFIKELAVACFARYVGMDEAGCFTFKSQYDSETDPDILDTINIASSLSIAKEDIKCNKLIIKGAYIIKQQEETVVWRGEASSVFDESNGQKLNVSVLNGAYFPDPSIYGEFWAVYDDAVKQDGYARSFQTIIRYAPGEGLKYDNNTTKELIGVKNPTLLSIVNEAGKYIEYWLDVVTFDTSTSVTSAKILLKNNSGITLTVTDLFIRGKKIYRLSGENGYIHDKYIDENDILENGETIFELYNNAIIDMTQINKLADFYWKKYHKKNHTYNITLQGDYSFLQAGEFYTLQIGTALDPTYINSVVECFDVSVERNAENEPDTVITFKEIYENWKFDSNLFARIQAAGKSLSLDQRGNSIFIGASTYSGAANYYCDGVDDDVQIQAAIDLLYGSYGGGTIELSEGVFNISNTIIVKVNIIGQGEMTSLYVDDGIHGFYSNNTSFIIKNISIYSLSTMYNDSFWLFNFEKSNANIYDCFIDIGYCAGGVCVNDGNLLLLNNTFTGGIDDYQGYPESVGPTVISITNSNSIIINNNTIYPANKKRLGIAMILFSNYIKGNFIVNNNNIIGNDYGSIIFGIYVDLSLHDIILADNNISMCSRTGIYNRGIRSNITNNLCYSNRNLLHESPVTAVTSGTCEYLFDEVPPCIDFKILPTEGVPIKTNCTWERSADFFYEGNYAYKFTKTNAVGTSADVTIEDKRETVTNDMHELIAGHEYRFRAFIYIPAASGVLGSEINLEIGDYASGWQYTNQAATNVYDEWQLVSVTRTIRATATGTTIKIKAASTAAINEYFYVDDIRFIPQGVRNDHNNNFIDNGTYTRLG